MPPSNSALFHSFDYLRGVDIEKLYEAGEEQDRRFVMSSSFKWECVMLVFYR